jgi:hypothetical protein
MRDKRQIQLFACFACFAVVFTAFSQDAPSPPVATEENILSLLKAMFFQLLNSPASLLLTIGISILSAAADWFIRATERLSNKLINPSVFLICVLGGGLTYRFFASPGSIDKIYPHPQAVLFVNGLVCGLAAFIVHVTLVRWIITKVKPTGNTTFIEKPASNIQIPKDDYKPDEPQAPTGN